MKIKTHIYVTPRNNEKARVWKEASRNRTLQRIFCFRLCHTMGSLKFRISTNIINQIRSIKGCRPEGRFSSTPGKTELPSKPENPIVPMLSSSK